MFLKDSSIIFFLLIFFRAVGFMLYAPVFSERTIPSLVKLAIALLFTVFCFSLFFNSNQTKVSLLTSYPINIFLNFIVGALLGFLTNLVITMVIGSGQIIESQMALNAQGLLDPSMGSGGYFARFLKYFALVILLWTEGIHALVFTFVQSFQVFPVDFLSLDFFAFTQINYIILMTSNTINLAVIAASPIIVSILFMDIVLGVMSRAAQQINPFQLSFSFKPVLGTLVFLLTIPFFQQRLKIMLLEGVSLFKDFAPLN